LHRQTHFSIKESVGKNRNPNAVKPKFGKDMVGASALPKMGEVTSYAALQSQTCKSSTEDVAVK